MRVSLYFDYITFIFLFNICVISGAVLIYSKFYIVHDLFNYRFLVYILIFIISILIFVIRANFVAMLLGWDGLGIVSYLLVTYYYSKKAINSGVITIFSNRIGDLNFLVFICLIYDNLGWNYIYINSERLVFCFLLVAMFTKRAQVPFRA